MKAFTINPKSKIHVFSSPVSMVYGFPGLCNLVTAKMGLKPASGDLYVFYNKKHNYMKVLFWSKDGFCMFSKRLPSGKFDFGDVEYSLSLSQMTKLIDQVIIHGGKKLSKFKIAA